VNEDLVLEQLRKHVREQREKFQEALAKGLKRNQYHEACGQLRAYTNTLETIQAIVVRVNQGESSVLDGET